MATDRGEEHGGQSQDAGAQGGVTVTGDPLGGDTPPTEAAVVSSAPDLLADSLADYTRIWFRRVRSGESGALPVVLGLVAIVVYFQISQPSFLSASNIANLMGQAGFLITLAMAQTFPLLLGEIDLSLGFNMGIGATITVWMVSIAHPFPTWVAILAGVALTGAISAVEGLVIVFLRIPSFVVTLAGLLGLNGVLLWIYEQTGSVGNGGVIQLHNNFINDIVSGNMSPVAGWIALVVVVVLAGVFMITRDQRRRAHNLASPPLSVTLLKLAVMATIGVVLLLVLNHNRAASLLVTLEGVPWVVPVILVLLAIASILLTRTKFGRYMYAVGGNAEAARRAGISLSRIRVLAFAICGVLAGVSGLLYASLLGSISNNVDGGQYVLYSVAGAVIGGVSLFGGRGRIVGAVLGGFIVAVIYNGVILIGLGAAGQYIWTAVVLLAAVTLDAIARRGSSAT